MRQRRMLVGALGLLVAASGLVSGAEVRAQTGSGCTPVGDRDEMRVEVSSPVESDVYVVPTIDIKIQVENLSTRKTLPTDPDPRITRITATLVSCREGQILPEEINRSTNSPASDTMSLNWTPEPIPTNGPFAVEIVATGNRPGSPPQDSRVVVPFSLAVPPKRPVGVSAATDGDAVVVKWSNAEREADLVLYEVQRAPQGSGTYTTVTDGVVTASVDTVRDTPGPGAWRYRVLAIRRGAAEGDGVRSAPSSDATAEVAAPTTTTGGGGSSSSSSSAASATTSRSGSSTTTQSGSTASASGSSALRQGSGGSSTVDLSGFPTVNGRPVPRIGAQDTTFSETLPFDPETDQPSDELGSDDAEPQELGAEEPNQGLGQRPIVDGSDRRRSLGFVAFGLLLFVLSMTGLFLKSEVQRADDLDALEVLPTPEPEPDSAPEPEPAVVVATAVDDFAPEPELVGFDDLVEPLPAALPTRRPRRSVAPAHAPGLDIPDPVAKPSPPPTTRTRTPRHARGTSSQLPSRPEDDRRESGAAVRPRRRRTGEGNRRVPVG